MKNLSDQEAILRIKNGEIEEFSHIVKKYTRGVYGYVRQKVFDVSDVDDIVQKAFISFYRAISRFDAKKPILPYLFEIVKNEIKMYFRSKKQSVPLDEAVEITSYDKHTQELQYIDTSILDELSHEQKIALQLLYEGYSYQEIAKKLKKPLNTVRTLIRRTRLKLLKKKNEKA